VVPEVKSHPNWGPRWRRAWLTLGWGWAAAIVWLSLTPSPPTLDFEQSDKLGHFLAYGGLMFWFCQLYPKAQTRVYYAAGFIALGVGMEILQGMTDYRTFEVLDMAANTIGVFLGWAGALILPIAWLRHD
jgi:VanZ family protein